MKKIIIGLGVVVILIVAGLGFIAIRGEAIIRDLAVEQGTVALKTPVGLDEITISPFSGNVGFSGLTIDQPNGFGKGHIMSLDKFAVAVDMSSIMSKHIKLDAFIVDSPILNAVYKGGKTNFAALKEALGPVKEDEEPADIRMSIVVLELKNLQVSFKMDEGKPKKVKLADIVLKDLGVDEGGMAPRQIMRHVMDALEPQIAKAAVKIGLKSKAKDMLKKQMGKDYDKTKSKLKGLLSGLKKKKDG